MLPKRIGERLGRRQIILLSVLALLAGYTLWLQWFNRPMPTTIEHVSEGPDYYLRNFTLTVTGPNGLPQYVVDSEYMEYVAGQDTVTLLRPTLFFDNREHRSSWWIKGEKAEITERGHRILMPGKVSLEQHDEIRGETVRLETSDLLVLPEQRLAESQTHVSLEAPGATIEATGLHADLFRERLKLMHRVRGRYHVPPS